ncbi:hypothetical protein ABW21_db0204965 [Orbilia brochopaga]|nr:hypothetical protein ABW21_db0204965 [Drechslerella brochopaga]
MPLKLKKVIAKVLGKKKTPQAEHIYSRQMMLIAPLTANIALPELPISVNATPPPRLSTAEVSSPQPQDAPVILPAHISVPAYDQEGLSRIDAVACPAWKQSLSCSQITEQEAHKRRHYTFAKVAKRGTRVPTMPVGPKRLAALEAYEELDARALPISHPLPQFAEAVAGVEEPPSKNITAKPMTETETTKNTNKASGFSKIKRFGKRQADQSARGWGREGVDPGLQPRNGSPHLYGRDRRRRSTNPRSRERETGSTYSLGPFSPPFLRNNAANEEELARERIRYREFRRDT